MVIEEAAKLLSDNLRANMPPQAITVGIGEGQLFIYEHVKGLAKRRTLESFEGYPVIYKYIGAISPLS